MLGCPSVISPFFQNPRKTRFWFLIFRRSWSRPRMHTPTQRCMCPHVGIAPWVKTVWNRNIKWPNYLKSRERVSDRVGGASGQTSSAREQAGGQGNEWTCELPYPNKRLFCTILCWQGGNRLKFGHQITRFSTMRDQVNKWACKWDSGASKRVSCVRKRVSSAS